MIERNLSEPHPAVQKIVKYTVEMKNHYSEKKIIVYL